MNAACARLSSLLSCPAPGLLAAQPFGPREVLWTLMLDDATPAQLEARLDDRWLVITERPGAAVPPIACADLWAVLVRNAVAPAGCKTVLTPARSSLFQSEMLMGNDFELEQRLPGIIAAFRAVKSGQLATLPFPAGEAVAELEQLCAESGWVASRRASGRLTVTLRTAAGHQATVTSLDRGVRLWLPALDCASLPQDSRLAAAAVALHTTAALPLVRAAVDAPQCQLRFEALFEAVPRPEELNAAFGALSAAAEATGETILAIQDETLARDYLVIRGWSANANQQNERSAEK